MIKTDIIYLIFLGITILIAFLYVTPIKYKGKCILHDYQWYQIRKHHWGLKCSKCGKVCDPKNKN